MADKNTPKVEELVEAYKEAVSSGIAAIDAGMAQTTAAVKHATDSMETERTEYGKVWERASSKARKRNENITSMFPKAFDGMGAAPGTGIPSVSTGAKESVNSFIESEIAFSQAWMKSWMVYLSGLEIRSGAATQALLEGNAKAIASSQAALKNTVKFGETIIDWSLESAKSTRS